MKEKLTTQPYKGTKDWLPKEFAVQKYIFETWEKVCNSFGYKQYLTPLLESADMYRAKSGVLKDELFVLKDRADRELALRPEMTPSVTRLVASIYKESPKPIRLFSIANFFRNEAPQKGRLREFWQLNFDIFGEEKIEADLEIAIMCIEIMLAFNAPRNSFKLYINNRKLLDAFFSKFIKSPVKKEDLTRMMDKFEKLALSEFEKQLGSLNLTQAEIAMVVKYLKATPATFVENFPELIKSAGYDQINFIQTRLKDLGYEGLFEFKPNIIRGIDYYDGMIFEVFDMNPDNKRSLFGGGRYNGLSDIFGVEPFPATGCAPGNVTMELFLESWNLIPDNQNELYYLPLLTEDRQSEVFKIANLLRTRGLNIEIDFASKSFTEALRFANKRGFKKILILGDDEIKSNKITVKDLISGVQETRDID